MITPLMPDLFSRRSGIFTFREATSHTGVGGITTWWR